MIKSGSDFNNKYYLNGMVIFGIQTFLYKYIDDMIYFLSKYPNAVVFTGIGTALSLV